MKKTFVLISMLLLWTGLNAQENEVNSKSVDSRPDKFYLKKLEILEGKEYKVCRDYAENVNNQFVKGAWWSYKFRKFRGKFLESFTRPEWEKLELTEKNLTLFKRILTYENYIDSKKFNQYKTDYLSNNKFFGSDEDFFRKSIHFYRTTLDIDNDGENEIVIRVFNDGYKPQSDDYSKTFIVFIVVVDEKGQSVDENKSIKLRQSFGILENSDGSTGPQDDLETDTNIFFNKEKIYLETLWKRALAIKDATPLIKIVEIGEAEQKSTCLFKYHPMGLKK